MSVYFLNLVYLIFSQTLGDILLALIENIGGLFGTGGA